jgi:hypothetical protein
LKVLLLSTSDSDLAASIAPEDLQRGNYVALLSVTHEYPSFFWCSDATLVPRGEPVRIPFTGSDGGIPLKIKAICLPFVFVKDPTGKHRHLDTRLCRLVRLSPSYAKSVWKLMKKRKPEAATSRSLL